MSWREEWLCCETSGAIEGTGWAELVQQEVVDELLVLQAEDETWVTVWAHKHDKEKSLQVEPVSITYFNSTEPGLFLCPKRDLT